MFLSVDGVRPAVFVRTDVDQVVRLVSLERGSTVPPLPGPFEKFTLLRLCNTLFCRSAS